MRSLLTTAVLIFCLLAISFGTVQAIDSEFLSYQGRLDSSGTPLNGNRDMTFRLFPTPTGGSSLWQEQALDIPVSNGLFTHLLGSVNTIPDSVFNFSELWLEVEVEGQTIGTRSRLTAVAVAKRVASVDDAAGGTISGTLAITGASGDSIIISPNDSLSIIGTDPAGNMTMAISTRSTAVSISLFDPVDSKDGFRAVPKKRVEISPKGVILLDTTGTDTTITISGEGGGTFTGAAGGNGAVQFDDTGSFAGDSANFFWDNTNKRLGIGTASPGAKLDVFGSYPQIHFGDAFGDWTLGGGGTNLHLSVAGDEIRGITIQRSTGNVGIGTTTPGFLLELQNSGNYAQAVFKNFNSAFEHHSVLTLFRARGTAALPASVLSGDNLGSVEMGGYDGTVFAARATIKAIATENWSPSARGINMKFFTTANGTNAQSERMVIDHSGNVGIGTTSPSGLLHVSSNASASSLSQNFFECTNQLGRAHVIVTNAFPANFVSLMTHGTSYPDDNYLSDGQPDAGLAVLDGQGQDITKLAVGTHPAKPLSLFTSNTERLLITPTGNIGIGTTSPSTIVDIVKNQNDATILTLTNTTNGINASAYWSVFSQNNNVRAIANSDGLTRSYPGFHAGSTVLKGSATNGLNIISDLGTGTAGSGTGLIRFITSTTDVTSDLIGNDSKTRMVIDATGNVGIGTTTPDYKLEVSGPVMMTGASTPGALSGHSGIYSNSGELFALDAGANSTQLSPHDPVTGEWIFYSKNIKTGRVVRVDMERLVKKIEELTGEKFMIETFDKTK